MPPTLATLDAAVMRSGRRGTAVAACTDVERWLEEHPLEVRDSIPPSASLPPVDWLARLSLVTTPPAEVVPDDEPLLEGTLAQPHEIAWALVLAAQHLASECEYSVAFGALRRAANALLAIETTARRGLTSTTLDVMSGDRASRAVREGLLAMSFAENLVDGPTALRTIAVAAMAQTFLDKLSDRKALDVLRAEVARDTRLVADVVTAYEALCIRRERPPVDSPLQARVVALACDEARLSLIEGRRSSLALDLDSIELALPPNSVANGVSTLAKIPLAHVVATARERTLSATVVLTDPRGRRHVIVFRDGKLDAVHSRAPSPNNDSLARLTSLAALPEDTEIAFFWGMDLLSGRGKCVPRPAAEVLFAIARGSDRTRMRAELEKLATSLVVHADVDALAPTDDERRLLTRWNEASSGERTVHVRVLTGELALPLAYTLVHLGEAHPRGHRCSACNRAAAVAT